MLTKKFLEYLLQEKRYSPNTVQSYQKDLEDFENYLAKTEDTAQLHSADKRMVRNFMIHLSENGFAKRSINRKLSSLRSFYNFLLKLGEIEQSPVQTISSLKFYPEKQIPFSQKEMDDLRVNLTENGVETLIIEMLYQTGLRKGEICAIKISDVDFSKNEITVHGKGNKMRLVPLSANLSKDLETYLLRQRPKNNDEKCFFLTNNGKKIYPKFVYNTVKNYLSTVTTKEKKSPHMLRHTFATHLLNNGAEISKVKSLLGHASLASTQVYTNANIEELKEAFRNAHPKAKENQKV